MAIKGVYLTSYNLKNEADGVSKKINYQIQSMTNKGLNVDILDLNSMKCSSIDNIRGRKIFCVYGKNSSLIRNRYV